MLLSLLTLFYRRECSKLPSVRGKCEGQVWGASVRGKGEGQVWGGKCEGQVWGGKVTEKRWGVWVMWGEWHLSEVSDIWVRWVTFEWGEWHLGEVSDIWVMGEWHLSEVSDIWVRQVKFEWGEWQLSDGEWHEWGKWHLSEVSDIWVMWVTFDWLGVKFEWLGAIFEWGEWHSECHPCNIIGMTFEWCDVLHPEIPDPSTCCMSELAYVHTNTHTHTLWSQLRTHYDCGYCYTNTGSKETQVIVKR